MEDVNVSWSYDVIYGDFASVVNHTDSTAGLIAYRG